MTMTRERIEELKRLYAAMTNCDMYGEDGEAMVPKSLLDQFGSLLALAERALEPQGQVLCRNKALREAIQAIESIDDGESPEYRACQEAIQNIIRNDDNNSAADAIVIPAIPARLREVFSDEGLSLLTEYAESYARAYASQLALPAGPVPEGD